MTRTKSTYLALVAVLLSPMAANADLIEADWKLIGDNLITVDEVGGLEWLDISETLNRSYNDVLTEFGAGGDFEGWQYATANEWDALEIQLGINFFSGGFPTQQAFDAAMYVQDLMGYTYNRVSPGYGETWGTNGMLETSSTDYVRYNIFTRVHRVVPLFGQLYYGASFYNTTFDGSNGPSRHLAYESRGSYLTRVIGSGADPVNVPEPGTLALLGIGLVGMGLARRRKAV